MWQNKTGYVGHINKCIKPLKKFFLFCFLQTTEEDHLEFDCHTLLHEMVSQVDTWLKNAFKKPEMLK